MLKEEKMKTIKIKIALILSFCIFISTNTFADLTNVEYFDGIEPQKHINSAYSQEMKNSLSGTAISTDNVEDLIHVFNPEVLNNWNNWESNKSSQDIYNDYLDAADNLYSAAGGQDSAVQEGMLYAQADAMRIQADKNADDSYTKFLTYYLAEKKLVKDTKIMIYEYKKSESDILSAKESYNEAVRKEQSAKNALNYGSGTQVEYLTAKKNTLDAKSSIVKAESSNKTHKRNIIINCGKSMNDNVSIEDPDLSLDLDASTINIDNDYQKALSKNIQYEIYKRKKDNAITEEVKKEYQILIDAAPQKIYNDLETKYSAIIDVIDTYSNYIIALDLANDNFLKAKNEYANGNISLKEYKTAEYNVNISKCNIDAAKCSLKIAIENYKSVIEGLTDC